ncbi:exosortase/archaeosortase family protein [Luteitalea sp.]|jgi:exosortase|uniref:exosortase/archaeosortase family protein n=1 Tax=Luteitalea sp. TaxID=2004800 RepID=UPI0037CC3BFE
MADVRLWLVLAAVVALYAPTLAWLWERWTMSVWHNAHGMLIPVVVAYFVRDELERFEGPPEEGSAWGFVWLIPALLMQIIDGAMHTQLLSAASIVVAAPGLAWLFLGPSRARAILFPLLFLAFMLPIPLGVTERLHLALRHLTAAGVEHLVPLVGVPLFREGLTLHSGESRLFVADACSGFSTLYAAMTVALLTAYFCPVVWRRLLVVVAAAPIAIAANILRVSLLVVLVRVYGDEVLETWLHEGSGILTFVLALPLIFWLGTPPRTASDAAAPATHPS